jgi:hypothetical protein
MAPLATMLKSTREADNTVNTNQATQRNLGRISLRIALGIFAGYLAYLPGLVMILFIAYGRIDRNMFLEGLALPLQLPLLATADFRESLPASGLLLQAYSVVLMAFTTFLSLTMQPAEPTGRHVEVRHG